MWFDSYYYQGEGNFAIVVVASWATLISNLFAMPQTCLHHSFDSSQQIQKLLSQARKLVGHFHHSTLATEALYACQAAHSEMVHSSTSTVEQQPVKVIQDVSAR